MAISEKKMSQNKNSFPTFFKLGFSPCNAEQPLQGIKLQEKETQKD